LLLHLTFRVQCGGSIYATPVLSSVILRGSYSGTEQQQQHQQTKLEKNSPAHTIIQDHSIISTLAFVCTTKGSLLAISFPTVCGNEDKINNDQIDIELSVIWESHFEVPVYGTPLVSTIYGLKKSTENLKKSINNEVIDMNYVILVRKDKIVLGLVDGTVRCMLLTSEVVIEGWISLGPQGNGNVLNYSNDQMKNKNCVDDNTIIISSNIERNVTTVGEESWRVSYALRPIFSSPIFAHSIVKQFFNFDNTNLNLNMISEENTKDLNGTITDRNELFHHEYVNQTMKDSDDCIPHPLTPVVPSKGVVFGSHDGHLR
jgi:hypothetical protein